MPMVAGHLISDTPKTTGQITWGSLMKFFKMKELFLKQLKKLDEWT